MMRRVGACLLVVAMFFAMGIVPAGAAGSLVARCNVRLRKQANTKSDTLVIIIGGEEIQVLGTSGGWTKTTYKGHTGYVATENLMELTRSGYYPLHQGDENPYVKDLQLRLQELDYLSGSADGKYGASTQEAVKSFQKNNNIKQDGIAGGETQRVLFGAAAKAASGETAASLVPISEPADQNATPTISAETLKLGSRGEDVKALQQRLVELGYLSGKADGIFGASTEKAVADFQKRSSLTADGKAGKVTQNLLYSTGAKNAEGVAVAEAGATETANATTYATLKKGMTNTAIKKMQEALKDLGYMAASATGYFGTSTFEAVTSFQKAHNLKADGIAGTDTQRMLYSADANAASAALAPTAEASYATLKEGMKSSAVTTMQKKLKELGYMSASATGYFGTATKQAVVAFQKANNLAADGIAGSATLRKLYGTDAAYAGASASATGGSGTGKITGPAASSVKLLHWFNSVRPSLKTGNSLQIYDPATGYGWKLKVYSMGNHCDSEPLTAEDTLIMNAAFGGVSTWTPKPVYVKLTSGTWTMATMHNVPHLSGSIANNNFDGHLCVHFLRDMDEVSKNDPNYGVQHQKALREAWKKLTGTTVN